MPPLHRWAPERVSTLGGDVAEFGEFIGLPPDSDQRDILDAMYGRTAAGKIPFSATIIAPRQNLKTSTLIVAALYDLFVDRVAQHVWTAHNGWAVAQAFEQMLAIIEDKPALMALCATPRRKTGEEAIRLKTHEKISFVIRSKRSARSVAAPRITLDEGLFLEEKDMGSLLPTMATIDNAQVRIASSAGLIDSAVLRGFRENGRRGGDQSVFYVEFGAERKNCADGHCAHVVGSVGCALDDRTLWAQANPAMGRRITEERIGQLRTAMPPDAFSVEMLSWWQDPLPGDEGDLIDMTAWDRLADPRAEPQGRLVLAIDSGPGGARSSIAVADDRGVVMVVDNRPGMSWLVEAVTALVARHEPDAVLMLSHGSVAALLPALAAAGLKLRTDDPTGLLVPLNTTEECRAAGSFRAAVMDPEPSIMGVHHRSQPVLDAALAHAKRKVVGESWRWARDSDEIDLSPLVAVSLARWGVLAYADNKIPALFAY